MQKINGFSIIALYMRGFKCFMDETRFEFGDTTLVKGANGLGKSSIADAIAFVFTGTNFFGEKSLDRLRNPEAKEMEVSVRFVDDDGEIHTLDRVHKRNTTEITLDGVNVRQTDVNEVFGSGDLFISMLNPLYFIETLGTEGKDLLESLLPVVSHEAVLAALPDSVRDQLENEKLLSPGTYIKNRRAEIRDIENDLLYFQGRADSRDYDVKAANEAIQRLSAEIENLDGQDANSETNPDPLLSELYKEYREISGLLKQTQPGDPCPSCSQTMHDDGLAAVKTDLRNWLGVCVEAGKRIKSDRSIIQELNAGQRRRVLETELAIYQAAASQPGFEERMQASTKRIEVLKSLVNGALLYVGKKNELLFSGLQMNRVKFMLSETVKTTGEVKDVFKITYNSQEYKRLSLSEKIRAGLEITELIKNLSGRNYPTFIDNSESICVIDNVRPKSQMIFAIVEKGRQLTVTPRENTLRKAG